MLAHNVYILLGILAAAGVSIGILRLCKVIRIRPVLVVFGCASLLLVSLIAWVGLSLAAQLYFEETYHIDHEVSVFHFDTPWYADIEGRYIVIIDCGKTLASGALLSLYIRDDEKPDNVYPFQLEVKGSYGRTELRIDRAISRGTISIRVNKELVGARLYMGRKL